MSIANQRIDNHQLEGLSILMAGHGTIELQRSIFSTFLELGCEIYWNRYSPMTDEVFEHSIDFVFHLSLFSYGSDYINTLRKSLDRQNPAAIIVNLSMGHPIPTTVGVGLDNVDDLNTFIQDRRIVEWSICANTLEEWRQYGLCNGIFAPLGISEWCFLSKNLLKDAGDEWVNKSSEEIGLIRFENISDKGSSFEFQDSEGQLIEQKIVYAGLANSPWEKLIAPYPPEKFRFLVEELSTNSKAIVGKICDLVIEPGNMRGFLEYHHIWSIQVAYARRRFMVKLLSKHFPKHVSIWGDGWDKYINHSHPTGLAPRHFYDKATCCVDFGSREFDTALIPRTCEIIKKGGLLISGLSDDKTQLVKENQFKTGDEMLQIIEETLDPMKRHEKLEKQKKLFHSKLNFREILYDIIAKANETI